MALAPGAAGADLRPAHLGLDTATRAAVRAAVLGLDTWLEAQRLPGGYGGPVVHWWRDSLAYTGPGLDWRYEGIIIGYLNLSASTGESGWLAKARRAGDDLLAGQLPSGNFRNSRFELNPGTGGTPHEAACDLALLRLAQALRAAGESGWERFVRAAECNLGRYFLGRLWDDSARTFRDDVAIPSFVPNKAATTAEALLALAEVTGDAHWAERYALPTLDSVVAHQVVDGALAGAIYQNSLRARRIEKFFPLYVARCIPALLAGQAWSGDKRFGDAALLAASWVARERLPDGSYPQVVYSSGRTNRYPQWIAGVGDVLRALSQAHDLGLELDLAPSLCWLLAGCESSGAVRTAVGFGRATPGAGHPDPRDSIAVCGWADKTFRFLARIYEN